ncbi:beta-ketoacyl synthase [Alcanivorax sp. 1008]|uniref:beta-ketoacyl synthase n=1 Tax=Alcanivorax sp. 1008 TaxID=2816853 RepID=UPI001D62BA77|nr:beta-ketoacyl synthase [Alcanivorax sp. 1008]MCC1497265.1 beta-ketoacyl synthase [Alcanivorax sp. 1008]
MSVLPVITALGGISPAGRSACHHGFQRLIFDVLSDTQRQQTLSSLSSLCGHQNEQQLLDGTLVRRLDNNLFDSSRVPVNVAASNSAPMTVTVRNMDLPTPLPPHWQVKPVDRSRSELTIPAGDLLLPAGEQARVQAAGQLPQGFDPSTRYASRHHPRALQMTIFGASECVGMAGIPWQTIAASVPPEQIAVYASGAMSQLDDNGLGGMLKYPHQGKRITSKQCPLGLGEMPADFINAYVLGSVGRTGGMLGACASFLYNLSLGVHDIRSGRARVALVGAAEAPLVAEIFEGYRAMGALAEDEDLLKLDPQRSTPDWRRAVRPFGHNCGFTLAESAQFFLLMDDALALELGADILAAVPDVFVHADGVKKSISAPGIGNYLTLGRATALARQLIGEQTLQRHSFVSAHGTSTPQNRVTESDVLDRIGGAFGIDQWPVHAVKAYLGHSLASASGDQLMSALGTFHSGWLPGITSTTSIAEDVHRKHLDFVLQHRQLEQPAAAFLNSKGFGGNNATALVLSAQHSLELLQRKHGTAAIDQWQGKREATTAAVADYEQSVLSGEAKPIYQFGTGVLDGSDLQIHSDRINLPGQAMAVEFRDDPDFKDFL